MIGFLRFIGVINAAVWLGGAVFFTFGAGPAFFSADMGNLLGVPADRFRYFAGGIAQIVIARYFVFHVTCLAIATLHLLAEWLYFGRPARRFSFGLLAILFALTLIGGGVLQPKLKKLRDTQYSTSASVQPAEREAARASFRTWHAVSQATNLLMIGSLVAYVWRVTNPTNTSRFISSVKFRG